MYGVFSPGFLNYFFIHRKAASVGITWKVQGRLIIGTALRRTKWILMLGSFAYQSCMKIANFIKRRID